MTPATRNASALNFVTVERPANSAPSLTPTMFVTVAKMMAPAAR